MSMALQTTYNSAQDAAYAGQLEGMIPHEIVSMKNATASTSMPFGTPVKIKGSPATDLDADVLSANTDVVFGLIVHSHAYARQWTDQAGNKYGDLDSVGLVPGTILNVLRRGRIAVLCTSATNKGDALHCAFNATGATYTAVGQVGGTAETGHSIKISGTQFLQKASAGSFAWLDADFVGCTTTAD